jgi:predicted acylesterase/phospholipase RssA
LAGADGAPYRVLSLDGGGIRGYYAAVLLSLLARHYAGAPGSMQGTPDPGVRFDLVCGTSVGAILACAVAAGVPTERVAALFRDEGPRIFRRPSPIDWRRLWWCARHWRAPSADASALRSALERVLGTETLAEVHRRRGIALCLVATDLVQCRLRLFRTPHAAPVDADVTLVDACMASAAAPILFAPVSHMGGDRRAGELLCDGGLGAGNPLSIALREALAAADAHAAIHLLSIGTGSPMGLEFGGGRKALGYWIGGLRLMQMSLDVQSRAAVDDVRALVPWLARATRMVRLLDPPMVPAEAAVLRMDNPAPEAFEIMDRLAAAAATSNIAGADRGGSGLELLPSFFRAVAGATGAP